MQKDHLNIVQGEAHEHLGMAIDFRQKERVVLSQCDSIKKCWLSSPEELRGSCDSVPAPENLFKVDESSMKFQPKMRDNYYAATVTCLYFSQRSKTDLQLSTGHHCTRVKEPTDQDVANFRCTTGHF